MKRKVRLLWILLIIFFIPSCRTSKEIRSSGPVKTARIVHQAHLSSGWYAKNKGLLNHQINDYFEHAQNNFYVESDPAQVRAFIVPHAGHYYSGLCAATAYQTLLETRNLYSPHLKNKKINRVIILAPSHKKDFNGISIPDYTVYKTPLGEIEVDMAAWHDLAKSQLFRSFPEAHVPEHAVEIQLPFLQKSIEDFKIVPLVVGRLDDGDMKEIIRYLREVIDSKTLVVVSTDFMHHGPSYGYDMFNKNILHQVRYVDSLAYQAIENQSINDFDKVLRETRTTICGQNPIKILLMLAKQGVLGKGTFRLSCYYTSPHMTKARQQAETINTYALTSSIADKQARNSVSYIGCIFTTQNLSKLKKENQLTGYEKRALLGLARSTVENEFKAKGAKVPDHLLWPLMSAGMRKSTGVFVTINSKQGKLQGCIGQIASMNPLYKTVMSMAKSAAFKDTRFKPLKKDQLNNMIFDVTILTSPEKISSLHEVVIGKHGIILSKFKNDGSLQSSSVFLPQVPPSFGWDLAKTLEQLSIKAGLGPEGWKDGCQFQIFQGVEMKEEESE